MVRTINKAEALKICAECPDKDKPGICDFGLIEGAREEEIITPACLLTLLTIKPADTVRNSASVPADNETIKGNTKNTTKTPIKINNSEPIRISKRNVSSKTHKNAHSKKENYAFSGECNEAKKPTITGAERKILQLISQGITDTNKIAKIQSRKPRIIQYHIKSLREKGAINKAFEVLRFEDLTNAVSEKLYREPRATNNPGQVPSAEGAGKVTEAETPTHEIRLHGEQFLIGILGMDASYSSRIGKRVTIDHNTILCHKDTIEIYSNTSFFGTDAQDACSKSCEYWNRIYNMIENDLKITIVKERAQNIKMVKSGHYAEIGSELAIDAEEKSYKIQIRTTDDKKVWFLIDNSFNFHEAETVHSRESKRDMQDVIAPFFNDLRDKRPPLPSEAWLILNEIVRHEKEIGAGLATLIKLNTLNQQQKEQKPEPQQKEREKPDKYNMEYHG